MAQQVLMKHKQSGLVKKGFFGFSWTSFFWGFFVPLFRADWGQFFLWFLLGVVTCGFSNIIQGFVYNKLYTRKLLELGYEFADGETRVSMAKMAIGVA